MIRILIVDDHAIVRAGLREVIEREADMEITGEAASGKEVIELARNGDWDVVLLDIAMPDGSGVDTLQRLKHLKPGMPVLILSGFPESQYAINLIRAGASGYVNKDTPVDELVAAIRTVTRGQKYVSPRLAQILANNLTQADDRPPHDTLTEREFQIFCKLAAGVSVSRIAEGLNLSVKTVSTYRSRVLEKMNMRTNADLTTYAVRNRLIE